MVFTALWLVILVYAGTVFDDMSKYVISVVFVAVALLLLRYYLNYWTHDLIILSVVSFAPYLIWFILDDHTGGVVRHTSKDLFTIVLPTGLAAAGLDIAFRYMRNPARPQGPPRP
ncbi:MAG: hypothetical protein GC191_16425 [Azospirillum sp.]|nr:hypothetical protein [Azospirillum sp.]